MEMGSEPRENGVTTLWERGGEAVRLRSNGDVMPYRAVFTGTFISGNILYIWRRR